MTDETWSDGSDDTGSAHAGPNDAGSHDAGPNDAGPDDAGSNDAGPDDATSGAPATGDRVARAMLAVPRAGFLPPEQRPFAAEDRALPLWHGQTGSQPRTVAAMLRLLDVPTGAVVLDVGAGSGWTTALLAHLVGPSGEVLGLELVPELASWGAANLARHTMAWARLEAADPRRLGRERAAGWDRILVSAAPRRLPAALVDQLGTDARMVIPVRTTMTLVERRGADIRTSAHGRYAFVPLHVPAGPLRRHTP